MGSERKIRVLISKIGLDGHDVGAKVLVQWLRDQGMEVIYTGLRQTVDQVVEAALQEAVDVIGVSILSGSHLPIARRLLRRMEERGIKETLTLFGGTIPKEDVKSLKAIGIEGVFPSHAHLEEISDFIRQNLKG
jgi:methylmalonyl-CoA mutase C-terminal domain/subunit